MPAKALTNREQTFRERCTLGTMRKLCEPLGPTQAKLLRHWVQLDGAGLFPNTQYMATRFSLSLQRIRDIQRTLKNTGYLVVHSANHHGLHVNSRFLTVSKKAKSHFQGGANDD